MKKSNQPTLQLLPCRPCRSCRPCHHPRHRCCRCYRHCLCRRPRCRRCRRRLRRHFFCCRFCLIAVCDPRLLGYEKLWYLFYRYLHVSPGTMQKCMLHDSVKYQNTCSRDPNMLLSMDIMVETFLEISVSDLLVLTQRLQDPLYLELWETYLSLSIGLGKGYLMISHDISLIMSIVEWLTSCITHLCLLFSNFKLIKTSLLSSLGPKP